MIPLKNDTSENNVFHSGEMEAGDASLQTPAYEKMESKMVRAVKAMISESINAASIMRCFGVIAMIAATSSFLLQGWDTGDDLQRYYLLLAQTVLLAGGGLGLSYVLKENKGARAFFGLSALSISAIMAVLGALIFSVYGTVLSDYPSYLTWSAIGSTALFPALAAGLAVAVLVLPFSYKVFSRNSAGLLTLLAVFTNGMLLIPVRESLIMGGIILLSLLVPAIVLAKRKKQDITLHTPSGMIAMTTIFVPAVIMTVRTYWLYGADEILELMLFGVAFYGLHQANRVAGSRGLFKWIVDGASILCAVRMGYTLHDFIGYSVLNELEYTVPATLFAGLMAVIAVRDGHTRPFVMGIGAALMALVYLLSMLVADTVLGGLVCMAGGGMLLYLGRTLRLNKTAVLGMGMIISAMAYEIYRVTLWIDFSNWLSLSILGATAIVFASLVERHGALIRLKWQAIKGRYL